MKIEEKEIVLKTGEKVKICSPQVEDAVELLHHLSIITKETRFLGSDEADIQEETEEQIKGERDWIEKSLASNAECIVAAKVEGQLVALGNISQKSSKVRRKHRCELGISVQKSCWSKGIGTLMMQALVDAAGKLGFEQMELQVVKENVKAIGLYKKFGFEVFGELPNALKYTDGTYANNLYMVKKLK